MYTMQALFSSPMVAFHCNNDLPCTQFKPSVSCGMQDSTNQIQQVKGKGLKCLHYYVSLRYYSSAKTGICIGASKLGSGSRVGMWVKYCILRQFRNLGGFWLKSHWSHQRITSDCKKTFIKHSFPRQIPCVLPNSSSFLETQDYLSQQRFHFFSDFPIQGTATVFPGYVRCSRLKIYPWLYKDGKTW